MFIYWGTKAVRKTLGVVADFCPLCRSPQAFVLVRLGMASHVYGISVGQGNLAGFERTCQQCKIVFDADINRYKDVIKKFPIANIAQSSQLPHLMTMTFPDLRDSYAGRLELEHDLSKSIAQLDPNQRHRLIKEPFLLLGPTVEQRYAQAQFDMQVAITLLVGIVLVAAITWLSSLWFGADTNARVPLIMGGAIVVAIIALLVQFQLAKGRHLRSQILPLLGKALRPLRPDPKELGAVLQELSRSGLRIGKRIKPQLLQQYL
ncbi:MAG: hypothetical protein ABI411_15635 [Tahibacter sp.]